MRDFSGQNLRGRSFRGQDLRGASFVNADIRGANFTDAELQGADFTGVIAGLQKRWAIGQTIVGFVLSMLLNFIAVILDAGLISYFFQEGTIKHITIVPGIVVILLMIGFLFALVKEGFTNKSFSTIIILLISIVVASFAVASAFSISFTDAGKEMLICSILLAGAIASTFAVLFSGSFVAAFSGSFVAAVAFTVVVARSGIGTVAVASAVTVASAILFLGLYPAWRSNNGDEKFALVRSLGLAFGSFGGTSFKGADLTDANFAQANLKSANFSNSQKRTTTPVRTNWKNAKKLDKVRPGNSILSNFKVLQLLTTGQGVNQDFSNFNLRGANLDSAKLNGANLKNADLSEASLCQADLTEVQAVGTNFTQAYLTGACLESWNIDRATLSGIDCAFYFLRETPDTKDDRDRRPHDPDRLYAPGDAEKLLTEAQNIVEVLLKQCTNAKDLAQALQRLTRDYPEANLQKLERKDNDFLVTLTVPSEADKADVETLLHNAYDEIRTLRGENKDLHTLRAVDLKDALLAIANHPNHLIQTIQQTTGDHTMTTQENQAISAGSGSFINTGTLNATNSTLGSMSFIAIF